MSRNRVYRGERIGGIASVTFRDDTGPFSAGSPWPLSPLASQAIRNHSPDGFEWGYGGSGPAQLALALLLDATGDADLAERHYQDFKRAAVAGWEDDWKVTEAEIQDWLMRRTSHASDR